MLGSHKVLISLNLKTEVGIELFETRECLRKVYKL